MSEWTCRYCEGGFPYPIIQGRKAVCPWCGQPIAKPIAASDEQHKRIIRHYDVPSSIGGKSDGTN